MSTTVCLATSTIEYPEGGGHFWVYLNWALGLQALGCQVIWLEGIDPKMPVDEVQTLTSTLKSHLEPYGFAEAAGEAVGGGALPAGKTPARSSGS